MLYYPVVWVITIYTSSIGGAANLNLSDYSNKTIYFDMNDTIGTPIQLNSTQHAIFDGLNNTFTCNSNFFEIQGNCSHIEIRNFVANYNGNQQIYFSKVSIGNNSITDTDITISYIYIHHNHITGFPYGISFEGINGIVRYCKVFNNYVYEAKQTFQTIGNESSDGYGIHLANAQYCEVIDNYIVEADRHSIYHAYGHHNRIAGNTIIRHCKNVSSNGNSVPRSAIPIYRNSRDVVVENNHFINCYNTCIHIYEEYTSGSNDSHADQRSIVIRNNSFLQNEEAEAGRAFSLNEYLPAIMVGYNVYQASYDWPTMLDDITIMNNHFEFINTFRIQAIRVYECLHLVIKGNVLVFEFSRNETIPATYSSNNFILINFLQYSHKKYDYDFKKQFSDAVDGTDANGFHCRSRAVYCRAGEIHY